MFFIRRVTSLLRPFVDRFPLMANFYRTVRNQITFMNKPVLTPWGFKLAGNSTMAGGDFEPLETRVVRKILEDVDMLVNVGANIGYYCCHALNKGVSVIAFEPIPQNLRYLCLNISINHWPGAEIYPIALVNKIGIINIYGGDTGASVIKGWAGIPDSYKTLVPSSTMDVLIGDRLHGKKLLIIVDVEGAEKQMLEGASKMMAMQPKPTWMIEIVATENQAEGIDINPNFKAIFQSFFENGYQAFSLDENMTPVTMDQVRSIAEGTIAPLTHNYIFCEDSSVITKLKQLD